MPEHGQFPYQIGILGAYGVWIVEHEIDEPNQFAPDPRNASGPDPNVRRKRILDPWTTLLWTE